MVLLILSSKCDGIPLTADENTSIKEAESQVDKLGSDLQNLDFIFHFLSDKFVRERNQDMKVFESANGHSEEESKRLKESLGTKDSAVISNDDEETVNVGTMNRIVAKQYIKNENSDGHSSRQKLLIPTVEGSHGRQNKVYWTDEELEAAADKSGVVTQNNNENQEVLHTSTRPRLLVPKVEEFNGRQNKVYWTDEELKTAAMKGRVNVQYDDENEEIPTTPTIARILVPKVEGSLGRQNKVYWTDEELEAAVKDSESQVRPSRIRPTSYTDHKRLLQSISGDKDQIRILQETFDDAKQFDVEDISFDRNISRDGSFAEDRLFAMSLSDLSVHAIEEIFEVSLHKLPKDIDKARDSIIEDIATKNMLGYTIATAYFLGAALDTVGDFFVNERSLADLVTDQGLWFTLGWLWLYAAGFAAPWLFPSTFNGGDPNLQCSSEDFLALLAESKLSTDVKSITTRSKGEMIIFTERLRIYFKSRLSCIVNKKHKYAEAKFIHGTFERLLDLISLHHELTYKDHDHHHHNHHHHDLDVVDAELLRIWDNMSVLVYEVHRDVTASRATRSRIFLFIGLLNLIASIFGVLMELSLGDFANIPAIPGFSPFINVNGRFSNDFLVGEALYVLAESIGWGYAYHMTYFLFVEEADPGCGLKEFDHVYSRYQQLRSFKSLMYNGEVKPAAAKYFVAEWRRELWVALHCLLSTKEGTRLGDTIDMFVTLANYRLDRTVISY